MASAIRRTVSTAKVGLKHGPEARRRATQVLVMGASGLRYTFAEYLQVDHDGTVRHEYLDGMIEVLSPSTEAYDRGEKLSHYQRIPALQHAVLVAHDRSEIEVWSRVSEGWVSVAAGAGERVELSHVGCALDVDAIYRDPLSE